MLQEGSVSVWVRQKGLLTYTLAGMHKLVPPPSRVNANVVPNILALSACPYTPEPPSLGTEVVSELSPAQSGELSPHILRRPSSSPA